MRRLPIPSDIASRQPLFTLNRFPPNLCYSVGGININNLTKKTCRSMFFSYFIVDNAELQRKITELGSPSINGVCQPCFARLKAEKRLIKLEVLYNYREVFPIGKTIKIIK